MATTKLPDEPEVIVGRYAFPEAQSRTAEGVGVALGRYGCGWFGSSVVLDRGSFAYVDSNSDLADRVGDYLRLTVERRQATVYVVGRVDDFTLPLLVARRVFLALAPLAARSVTVDVEVVT